MKFRISSSEHRDIGSASEISGTSPPFLNGGRAVTIEELRQWSLDVITAQISHSSVLLADLPDDILLHILAFLQNHANPSSLLQMKKASSAVSTFGSVCRALRASLRSFAELSFVSDWGRRRVVRPVPHAKRGVKYSVPGRRGRFELPKASLACTAFQPVERSRILLQESERLEKYLRSFSR